ncbi:Sorbose reductase sou1 [Parahypoxylon ruwenzoriense]
MADMKTGAFKHDNMLPPKSSLVMPLFSLKGRTAIVSGAGAGIGLAIAHAFGRAYQVNVTTWETVQAAVDEIVKEFDGRLDVFVANSGIAWEEGSFIDGSLETMQKVLKVNVDGTLYCARAAALHWRRQKKEGSTIDGKQLENFSYGSFVCTASMSGHICNIPQMQTVYNASKAAVIHACKSLAVEWVGFARANSVSPGYIKTDISSFVSPETKKLFKDRIPMGREGEPEELKGVYLYLASDASSYTTGTDIIVDGGYCAP